MLVMKCLLLQLLFMAIAVLQVSVQQGSVFIVGPTSVRTVFGSDEGLVCAAYLTDGDPMIIWSTNATGADLSNIIDFMDLPRYVEIVSLNITVDSGYCGTYTCTEKILSGSFSKQVTVDVAPNITEHPVHTSIGASRLNSDNVDFTCIINGGIGALVNITWYGPTAGSPSFNPQPQFSLANGAVRSTLILTGVTYNHTGDYWCDTTYNNAPGCTETSQSDKATLFIVEAPLLLIEPHTLQLHFTAGSTLSYHCSFNASNSSSRLDFQPELANFSVSWTGPLGAIENSSSYEVLLYMDDEIVNTTLIITNASSAEGGQYSCIAENIDGFDNGTILLYVDPVIQPTNYTVTINETLTITCDVQDFPAPSFTWQKEFNNMFQTLSPRIDTDGRVLNSTLKNLTFDPIIFGDEGVYRCVVCTSEFEAISSNEILLTVSPESGVSVSPINQIFEHDDNVTLSCDSRGGPANQFNWTITRNDVTTQGPLSSTFEQSPVMGGVYTCVVSNTAGFGSATTTVFISLRFIVQPNDTETDVGERMVLICEAESFPDPTYEWFRLDSGIRGNLTGLNASSVVLDSVLFGDEGEYFCSATSRTNFTALSRTATLTVSPKGSVSVSPKAQVANFTDDVTFSCQAKGGPNNTFQWYKDAEILASETNANISIFNVSSLEGGAYTCSVMNAAGSENVTATLYVRPYIVLFPESEITTKANRSINFTCMAQGFPPPSITWFKQNDSERIVVGNGDILEFNPVDFGDEGNYECFAMFSVPDRLNSTQAPALLTVSPEGSVGVSPVNLVYYTEDNVTFLCSFLGGLNNTIQWSKDGLNVNGETEREIVLRTIDAGDGGMYTCTVSNSAGRENASTTLFVAPYFIEHPVDVLSENGANVNFSCLAEAFPMPSYAWKRAEEEEIRTEAVGLNSSLLVYTSVLFGDEGVYRCEATILNMTVPSDNATLTLSPDEVNVTAMASDEVYFGQSVNLTCDHSGGPDNTYSWLKDGRPLNDTDTLLSLVNITAMDGGMYTCVVRNLAGNSNASIIMYVQPYITLFPWELVTVDNGSEANISCEAEGFPMPNITWIKYESFQNRSDFSDVARNSVLEFEPVLFGNEGFYACVASSRRFDGRRLDDVVTNPPSELSVSPLFSVRITAHNETYFLGDNTTLTCTSLGGPNNSYIWFYNREAIGSEPTLKVTNISADNGGAYTCIAVNNAGNDSDVSNLYVHPYITMAPELNIYTMDGEFVSLECVVDGSPAPNVTWESLGIEIQNGSGMESVSMDGINSNLAAFDNLPLEFSLVTFGDEGYYRCVVSAQTPEGFALETVMSQLTLVTVSPEGSVRVEPEFQVIERFDNITFECFSLGGPNNTYQWQKDTIDLSNETTPILTLSNVSAIDGGTYSCVVSNAAGNETVNTTLFIRPYITLNPTPDVLSFNGDFVSFDCEAESFPSPRYLWEKVSDNSTIVSDDHELVFAPVAFGVEGVYQCVAYITSNLTNLTASSAAVLLTVSPDAGVTSSPQLLNSVRNQTIQFLCISLGGPNNSFSWIRLLDQTLLSNSSLLEVSVDGEFSGGGYRCDVSNRAGNGSFQATLNVAPEISEHPVALNVTISRSFSLSCGANGVPIPEILWLLNGTEVDLLNTTLFAGSGSGSLIPIEVTETYGERSISSILAVSMAMTNDSGNYSCLIVSPVAEFPPITTDPARVLVQDVPDPPHSLISLSVTNTSMIVLWVEPHDSNAPIFSYTITYRHPSFLGGQEESVNSSAEMSFIGGLHPGVEYNFSVVAYNEIGASEPSVVTGLATLDEESDSPPPDLTVTVLSSTSVYFTWNELPEIDRNGIITAYEIYYTPLVNCSSISPGTRSGFGNSTQLFVDGLQENTEYRFRVRAYTSAGPGPYGESVVNNTLEDLPSGPPESVEVNCLSPTELSVFWDPINCSEQNGEIVLYQIRYETFNTFGGEITDPVRFINTSNRWVELSGLEEFNEYHVIVMGYTVIGAGPYSSPQSNITKQNVPSAPPMNLSVVTISSTELSLEWEHPPSVDRNGIITSYEVFYEPLNTYSGLITNASVIVPNRSAMLTGLEENTGYNVFVRAFTSVGPGLYTVPVTSMTLMDVPSSPPINVSVTTNQLMVTWDPVPEIHRNGPIIFYEVLYFPNNTFNGKLPPNDTRLTGDRSILLTLLEEFVVYHISVRAYTVEGPGNYSNSISQRTLTAAPSGPVQDVTAFSGNSTSITVRWNEVEPIDQNGIQTMYEIRFVPDTTIDGVEGGSLLTTTLGQLSLTGLEEFIVYIVSVRSFTDVGPGPYSANIIVRTINDVPASPPTSVRAEALSPTEISVTWDPVIDIDQNGEIIRHDVLYEPSETFDGRLLSSQTIQVFGVFAPVLSLTLTNLEEFLMYNISVRAATIRGAGPFSEAVNNTTEPSLPVAPPLNVSVTAVSSSEIRVTWEAPDPIHHNGLINEYDIILAQNVFIEIPPFMNVRAASSSGVNELLVTGLEEDVIYSVCVMALNSVGAGPCSGSLTGRTFEDRPTAPPRNLIANAAGPTNLSLAWSSPPSIHINGELTQYRIQYNRVDSDSTTQFNVSVSMVTTAVLNDLGNFTCYNVSISAYTRVGEGPVVSETGCTEENVPGEAPIVTEVRSNSFESILLQWEPPQNRLFGILRSFTVRYMNVELPNPQFVYHRNISSTARSFIIEGLIQFTNYSVELAAVTIGDGEFSDPKTVRTDQDKPDGSPVEIQLFPQLSNPRSLQVTWGEVPRSVRNGVITKYDIMYQPLENYDGEIGTGSVSTTAVRMVTLSGLEEDTEYNVSIRAYTVVGEGPFSEAFTGRTSEGIPSVAPPDLRVNITGSRNMTISWNHVPLIHRNGEIVLYTLSYGPVNKELATVDVNAGEGMFFQALDLIPATVYSIKVAASTSRGRGDFSNDITGETTEERPGEVSHVMVVTRFTSITVDWQEPSEPNGVIIEYDLVYNKTLTESVTISDIRPLTDITPSISVSNLTTDQTVTVRVRAYTRIGPGPYVTRHATTRDKPPEVTGLIVDYAESEGIATVQWSRLTGIDVEHVVLYKIVYSTEQEPSDLTTVYVEASENSRRIEGLLTDTKYLFRVLAIARIDNDTIEGDLSIINHNSVLAVLATKAPLETPEAQLGISIPFVVILTAIVCVIVFFVYLKTKQYCNSKKKPKPSLKFEEGHYESVEMIRRQLPSIPVGRPTLSDHVTPASVQLNASYRPVIRPQPIEDIYDNDEAPMPPEMDRYSTVQTPTTKRSLRAPKGTTVIANMETYDTVDHQTEQPVQDVYDNDPFEKDNQLVRRNSNPNVYSEVSLQANAKSGKSSKLDTSLIVSNPAHKLPVPKPKPYESLPLKKPSSCERPPTEDTGSSSGEEYEAMATTDLILSPSSTIVNGDIGAKQEDKVDTSLPERKAGVSEDATKKEPESIDGAASTGAKPYFEFTEEYDTIINNASMEAKTRENGDDVKKEPDSIDGVASTGAKDKAPYFEFNDEYDTIIHDASMEAKAGEIGDDVKKEVAKEGADEHKGGDLERETYMDMSGEQASRVE